MQICALSLSEVLKVWGDSDVTLFLNNFNCQHDKDLQNFIRDKAIECEKCNTSRTFLFVDSDGICGYVTLTTSVIDILDKRTISESLLEKINYMEKPISTQLIGKLCKDDRIEYELESTMVEFALGKFLELKRLIGGRAVCVDCKKVQIPFYEENGFIMIKEYDDNSVRMLSLMKHNLPPLPLTNINI